MTKSGSNIKRKTYLDASVNIILLSLTILFSITLSPKISSFVKEGLSLFFEAIVGSVFPFMIITDIVSKTLRFEDSRTLKRVFERVFKINGRAISAFILGAICGFPVGVKLSADMYERGVITKEECERLIAFSGNMGPAFIISGVGAALCGSIAIGVALYIAALISAIISGMILGFRKTASNYSDSNTAASFSLTDSIKNATKSTVTICGFVIFFSVICGVLSILIKNHMIYTSVLPFFEISNATKSISASNFIQNNVKLALIAFSVSFSGLSVYMQTKSFFQRGEISMKPYLFAKLLSGIISALIISIILLVI